jgi:hypothetical protein
MKNKMPVWIAVGIIAAAVTVGIVNKLRYETKEEPLQRGVLAYDYHWLPNDSTKTVVTVESKDKTRVNNGLREYEITAQNEAFTVRLSVLGREVESARILEARFRGQTEVTVYRDRIVTVPQTTGLAVKYQSTAPAVAPKERWIEAQILVGALLVPPYSPIIAGGVGIRRLPLIGKLPPVTLGAGWFGTGPGAFVQYRF